MCVFKKKILKVAEHIQPNYKTFPPFFRLDCIKHCLTSFKYMLHLTLTYCSCHAFIYQKQQFNTRPSKHNLFFEVKSKWLHNGSVTFKTFKTFCDLTSNFEIPHVSTRFTTVNGLFTNSF